MSKFKYLFSHFLSSLGFLYSFALSYVFTLSFHTFMLTSIGLLLSLSSGGICFIFFVWLQHNLLQFWVICFLTCFTNQPIPNSVCMSWMTAFWRCMGIFNNGICRFSLKHWRHDSFNLWLNIFSTSVILIFPETTSYSTSGSYVSMQDS